MYCAYKEKTLQCSILFLICVFTVMTISRISKAPAVAWYREPKHIDIHIDRSIIDGWRNTKLYMIDDLSDTDKNTKEVTIDINIEEIIADTDKDTQQEEVNTQDDDTKINEAAEIENSTASDQQTAEVPYAGTPVLNYTQYPLYQHGRINGPSGEETYYCLPMNHIVDRMKKMGFTEENGYMYWVREDGAKMLGNYVMVAANLNVRPRGTTVMTSIGPGLVCDTGGFAEKNIYQLDIATNWKD